MADRPYPRGAPPPSAAARLDPARVPRGRGLPGAPGSRPVVGRAAPGPPRAGPRPFVSALGGPRRGLHARVRGDRLVRPAARRRDRRPLHPARVGRRAGPPRPGGGLDRGRVPLRVVLARPVQPPVPAVGDSRGRGPRGLLAPARVSVRGETRGRGGCRSPDRDRVLRVHGRLRPRPLGDRGRGPPAYPRARGPGTRRAARPRLRRRARGRAHPHGPRPPGRDPARPGRRHPGLEP